MNEQELVRKLNSVGKTIFVEYFELFNSYSSGAVSRDDSIQHLVSKGVSNRNGAAIRCGNAKRIFEERKECDALIIVAESNRLSANVIAKAKKLLREECQ